MIATDPVHISNIQAHNVSENITNCMRGHNLILCWDVEPSLTETEIGDLERVQTENLKTYGVQLRLVRLYTSIIGWAK